MKPKSVIGIFLCASLFFWITILTIGCRKENPREIPGAFISSTDHCSNGVLDFGETEIDCGGPGCAACTAPCAHDVNSFDWQTTSSISLSADFISCSEDQVSFSEFSSGGYDIDFYFGETPQVGHFYLTDDYYGPPTNGVYVLLNGPSGPDYASLYQDGWVYVTDENGILTITVCDLTLKQVNGTIEGVLNGKLICN
jgi:hypothetical protein